MVKISYTSSSHKRLMGRHSNEKHELEVFPLDVERLPVRLHQLLQLLYVSSFQFCNLLRGHLDTKTSFNSKEKFLKKIKSSNICTNSPAHSSWWRWKLAWQWSCTLRPPPQCRQHPPDIEAVRLTKLQLQLLNLKMEKTLMKTTSSSVLFNSSRTGAIILHGPHLMALVQLFILTK